MNINGQHYHTIWVDKEDKKLVQIIDQRSLPHQLVIENLCNVKDVFTAIREMHVRGAPLIGVTAAFGMYFACLEADRNNFEVQLNNLAQHLKSARPTAVDLSWAIDKQFKLALSDQVNATDNLFDNALKIKQESIDSCRKIGQYGLPLIEDLYHKKKSTINILTHCNAGWLACIDHGTATAPIYAAHDAGIPVHVWVDETRPRNQGARLTAFELLEHGVPHTVIVDNAGGHLMQHGQVDMVIVGSDRTTRNGDVCNKIGTYLKALAANDNGIPFYVAVPSSSIDWDIDDGISQIPIEERDAHEVKYMKGMSEHGMVDVLLTPKDSPALNLAFDVTPARLVTAIITEKGVCETSSKSLKTLFDLC